MAEAFLQVLLDNLTSFIQGELVLIFGFENEFKKLSSTFSTIQVVLEDALEKQLKDEAIENWLQKLNAAAYEVDDILDKCKTEAARFNQSLLGCIRPNIITFRYKVGKRMKGIMEKLDAIAEERRKFHLREKIAEKQAATRETGFVLAEPQVYGRDKEEDEIVKILIKNVNNAQDLPVLPILGMGGLGKTTVAQMVFNNQRVIEHFNLKIWVCVSDDFDEKRLIKAIVESIEGRPIGDMDLAPLQKKLQELLNGKRYLLVLDDVWNDDQEKWAKLKAVLKVGARGASVLATTRLRKVGSIMGTLQPYQLSNLSQEDCWLSFMQRAFGYQKETNPDLMAIGKEIVNKCGGVPLAANTLGGLLRFKREKSEWEHVRDNEIWSLPQDETSILGALRLSYHHLPLDLRQCFAFCAVFPKDTKMEKKNLITLWMEHGFILSKGNLELEDVGNEVWKELYLRSFFQEVEEDKFGNTYFKMHDLIHDLATSLFSTNTRSSKIRQVRVAEKNIMSIGFAEEVPSYSPLLLKRFASLRVLDMKFSKVEQLSSSIGDLIHLRLLNLFGSSIRSLPKRLCKLQNLQTLDLSCCISLSYLPKQTSTLRSLRNLLFKCCLLTSMPPRIGSLTCLKTLECFVVGQRKGYLLGELRNLNLHGSLSITHLERVKNDKDAKEANLSTKANLYNLSMSWDIRAYGFESEKNLDEKVLEALRPHPNLKSLKLTGFRGFHFPNWMNASVLKNVVSIEIGCENCSCLPPFGELPCLETLKLYNGSAEVEYIEEDNGHSGFPTIRFPYLKRLAIERFPNLKGLLRTVGEDQFSMLEEMEIWHCPMFVFPTLSSVKKLDVWGKLDATSFSSISKLSTLTSLSIDHNLEVTTLPEQMFKLANLESLSIIYFKKLRQLPSSLASLNALKRLEIRYCYALESLLEQGMEGLTSLTDLYVQNCKMLKSLPEGLQHKTALTSLQVYGCPAMIKRCENGMGEDWHKIAHIPNVDIG
ncbi:putative disease resistance protein RGA3 [Lycium ferocissimum]|uniref:putative disease resistance protein RGA3 n=1 Tax=Lycium ferocissimum TaxID=112874 RepID=UPI0028168E8B|nr:putative disease resistance protein RGA3 [Lycium ferocissimum]